MFLRSNSEDSTGGPEDIINAVYSRESVTDVREAVLGEPELRDFGNEYFNDYHVVIPLNSNADELIVPFTFDLPENPDFAADEQKGGTLEELAGFYGIEAVEEIGTLEGETVPVDWVDGYPRPNLSALRGEGDE